MIYDILGGNTIYFGMYKVCMYVCVCIYVLVLLCNIFCLCAVST